MAHQVIILKYDGSRAMAIHNLAAALLAAWQLSYMLGLFSGAEAALGFISIGVLWGFGIWHRL